MVAASPSGSELDTAVHGRDPAAQPTPAVPGVDFRGDHFALFGLPRRFELDADALSQSWRRLQALVHPDRFAGGGAAQLRLAMQWSTLVNTAYRTLLDPLARAAYLCELHGVPIDAERNTAMPLEFLGEQMEWREELDAARDSADEAALRALRERVEQRRVEVLGLLGGLLDAPAAASASPADPRMREAAAQVRILMFIDKFRRDLSPGAMRKPSNPAA